MLFVWQKFLGSPTTIGKCTAKVQACPPSPWECVLRRSHNKPALFAPLPRATGRRYFFCGRRAAGITRGTRTAKRAAQGHVRGTATNCQPGPSKLGASTHAPSSEGSHAPIAQWLEHWSYEPRVMGSNPIGGTIPCWSIRALLLGSPPPHIHSGLRGLGCRTLPKGHHTNSSQRLENGAAAPPCLLPFLSKQAYKHTGPP